ncbi:MAG: hypothetical protein K2P39_08580 [Lachnospiraceae bacterium]|nr:hypothetical protein [Lachnospiraceae bacterium]
MKTKMRELAVWFFAVCSTTALFADVESTGNMSMALNGDGIPQLAALVAIAYGYRYIWIKGNMLSRARRSERIGYGVTAFLFAVAMIVGKAQSAHPDLKYPLVAIVLFVGYVPFFYTAVSILGWKMTALRTCEASKAASGVTKWLFEDHVMLGVMAVVVLCRIPYLIAFYPCSMSWDGGAQICDFYSLYDTGAFVNHHPPLVSFLYGAAALYAQKFGIPNLGMFLIPLGQTFLSAFAVAKVCVLFQKLRVPYWLRWAGLAYYGLFTVWCIFDVTYIKDSIYWPLSLLYAVEVVWCVVQQEDFYARRSHLLCMMLYGLLMTQTRNNGIFVLLFTVPVLFVITQRTKKMLFLGSAAVMFAAVFLMNNVLYPALGVVNLKVKEDTYCILFQQTAKYGQDYPEDVTQEERDFLNTMFDYDELVEVYNPRLADWVKNCLKICEATSADGTNAEFAEIKNAYFRVWFAQFMRHPLSYVNTFLECSYGYYYPEVKPYKEGNGFYEMDRNMLTEGMHKARQPEALWPVRFLMEQLSKLEYLPGIGLLYRCGFYTWCVVFVVGYLLAEKRYREALTAIPAAVNILVCLISPVNTCIRYALPAMCLVPVLFAVILKKDEVR